MENNNTPNGLQNNSNNDLNHNPNQNNNVITPGVIQPVSSPQPSTNYVAPSIEQTSATKKFPKKYIALFVAAGIMILLSSVFALRPNDLSQNQPESNATEIADSSNSPTAAAESFEVVSIRDYEKVCTGEGWPSNTASTNSKVTIVMFERRSRPGSYSDYTFDVLAPAQKVKNEKPTEVDRVACMSLASTESGRVECKFSRSTGIMIRKDYNVTLYDLKSKAKIKDLTIPSTSTCPNVASLDERNTFEAKIDNAKSSAKLAE